MVRIIRLQRFNTSIEPQAYSLHDVHVIYMRHTKFSSDQKHQFCGICFQKIESIVDFGLASETKFADSHYNPVIDKQNDRHNRRSPRSVRAIREVMPSLISQ